MKPTKEESEQLEIMFNAYKELQKLGWDSISCCPKDGTHFLAIEPHSTGVHECFYDKNKDPLKKDYIWCIEGGDLWPSRPILFKKQETNHGRDNQEDN